MNDLAVVIVSYNVRYYLEQCLDSVARASDGLKVEVWVVDNASQDGSVDYLSERFPHVHFIANEENVGFSRANNQAIRMSHSRYVLLLNPDTIVTERTLTDCMAFLDNDKEIGALGVSMYNADGSFALESRRGLPVPFTSFCKLTGLTALFPHSHTFGRYYMRFLDRQKAARIEVISGAFNMMRKEALDEIGLLDEDFFMYGEDVDLSYRMLLGGWQNYYLPTPIVHYKGESTQKDTIRYVNIFYEAMIIFMDKHFKHRYHHATLVFRLGIYLRAGLEYVKRWLSPLTALLRRRPKPVDTYLYGQRENLERMKAIVEKSERMKLCGEVEVANTGNCQNHGQMEASKEAAYVVYDMSVFTYGEMIGNFVEHHKRCPNFLLATYSPQSGVMILPDKVLVE